MDNKAYREIYETLPVNEKKMIDNIYDVVNKHCQENGFKISYSDDSEMFVGAITGYLIKSKVISI